MSYVPISEMTLTYAKFRSYRKDHPGPKTRKAYNVWEKNEGRDYQNFRWTERKKTITKIIILKKSLSSTKKKFNFTFNNYAESKFTLTDQ